MDTMKAVVYDRPGKFEVRQIALSEPGAGEVLLRVLVAGVCGTDLHLHHGEFGPTYPLIPGHEIVGEVVATGPRVTEVRVGSGWAWTTPPPAVAASSAGGPDRPIACTWLLKE